MAIRMNRRGYQAASLAAVLLVMVIIVIRFKEPVGEPVLQDASGNQRFHARPTVSLRDSVRSATMRYRKKFVRNMMKHAWDNYQRYAWGHNELHPIAQMGAGGAGLGTALLGATIIDSLDTLSIMGLQDELRTATNWVRSEFNLSAAATTISVFEANIRLLGGLLAAHALTKNNEFMRQAIDVADILMDAFEDSPSGLPYSLLSLPSRQGTLYSWLPGECVSLADAGTLHMEFAYLSEITGQRRYLDKVVAVRRSAYRSRNKDGLYPNLLKFRDQTGARCTDMTATTVGAFADSFYEYLLKNWLLSGQQDQDGKAIFEEALPPLERSLLQTSKGGFMYFAKLEGNGQLDHNMEHLACFIGGLYALSAQHSDEPSRRMQIARNITRTCHESYNSTRTRIGPEAFVFDDLGSPVPALDARQYSQRPEVVESYFYLWKLTGEEIYREWAWEATKAIEQHCRKPTGYAGLSNVDDVAAEPEDVQQSFFLAETLKYLYLIFEDKAVIPLADWVFNTEAHPLPVIGLAWNALVTKFGVANNERMKNRSVQ